VLFYVLIIGRTEAMADVSFGFFFCNLLERLESRFFICIFWFMRLIL